MIALLPSRLLHGAPQATGTGRHRLAVVEGLSGHLARVIHPHEPRCVAALGLAQRGLREVPGGVFPALRGGLAPESPQAPVEIDDDPIEEAQASGGLSLH
jgi:hypothetical protein